VVGVEVGEQLLAPRVQSARQPHQFGDLVVGDRGEPAQQPPLGAGPVGFAVEQPRLLGGDQGVADLLVDVAAVEPGEQPIPGPLGMSSSGWSLAQFHEWLVNDATGVRSR
jgi:hypothetical protein